MGATTGATYTSLRSLTAGRSAWGNLILQQGGGAVGIGTISPDTLAHLAAGAGSAVLRLENTDAFLSDNEVVGKIEFETQDSGGAGVKAFIQAAGVSTNGATKLEFGTGGSNSPETRMTINSNGNVGIGVAPNTRFQVSSATTTKSVVETTGASSDALIEFTKGQGSGNTWSMGIDHSNSSAFSLAYLSNGSPSLTTHGVLTVDTSGNFLVGTTSAFGTTGTTINQAGLIYSSADGDRSGQFDRTGVSDGEIVRFTKAGTTVGSIGSRGGVVSHIILDPRSGGAGLTAAGASLFPTDNAGTVSDAAIDLGYSVSGTNYRFKDLYLSGNTLAGTTSTNPYTSSTETGAVVRGDEGILGASRDGGSSLRVNRLNSNGDIAEFRKDGSTIGSIGVGAASDYLAVGNSNTSIQFYASGIAPATGSLSTLSSNTKDLGSLSVRWRDLYLSGGVVFGDAGGSGSSSSNTLDSYEEGTWTPSLQGGTTAGTTTYGGTSTGWYRKIGDQVTVFCQIYNTGFTGTGLAEIHGLPFTANNESVGEAQMNRHSSSFPSSGGGLCNVSSIIQSNAFIHMRGTYNDSTVGPYYVQMQNFTYLRITITYKTA